MGTVDFTEPDSGYFIVVRAPCGCVEGSCWQANVGELQRFLSEHDDTYPIVIADEAGMRQMPRRCDKHASTTTRNGR